ncbi:hypothetical protein CKAN_01381100 [Cinnamomum micranthum f. kanehirae]|uniref:Uncharacterized protein n=1 Tax=Cinnamomum micranthum f. kanehirae TaxID=337451 RepID=A0A3S3NRC6_9MAGN|nr:hypothetical protein CKAN_01381100 [Cinnamomum micranthum f. kanehirae]
MIVREENRRRSSIGEEAPWNAAAVDRRRRSNSAAVTKEEEDRRGSSKGVTDRRSGKEEARNRKIYLKFVSCFLKLICGKPQASTYISTISELEDLCKACGFVGFTCVRNGFFLMISATKPS